MSGFGCVSRVSPVQTALRNCTRDEGGPFGFGEAAPFMGRENADTAPVACAIGDRIAETEAG